MRDARLRPKIPARGVQDVNTGAQEPPGRRSGAGVDQWCRPRKGRGKAADAADRGAPLGIAHPLTSPFVSWRIA